MTNQSLILLPPAICLCLFSPPSLFVRLTSGLSAGTDWQLYGMRGTSGTPPIHLSLVLQKDLESGNVGQESWSECCSQTRGEPETGAREPDSKNKVVVCFRYSALPFILYLLFLQFFLFIYVIYLFIYLFPIQLVC